jgi:hypothetical protein
VVLQVVYSQSKIESLFMKMLDSSKYAKAINSKGQSISTEPLIMALLLSQHQLNE